MRQFHLASFACLAWLSTGQDVATDPGVAGPPLEIVHLYYDQWPTGEQKQESENRAIQL